MPPVDDDEVAEEIDINDAPAFVKEGTEDDEIEIAGRDVSQAQSASFEDWVEPAKDVEFEITKALIDTYTPKEKDEWKTRSLKLYLKVGKKGLDGKGHYAGKIFFPRILVAINPDGGYDFTKNAQGKATEWYTNTGGAWGPLNEVLTALGFSTKPAPPNNKAFRDSLIGRTLIANVEKRHRQVKDGNKYVNVDGEFENELTKYRAVKTVPVTETTEAAVA